MVRRSPYDREILRLAVPALGALAAEPLYVLVDTAIVGHLGTTQLAALAIAATVMTTAFTVFNFLTYGTTARVARLHGAGQEHEAALLGSQAMWLALAVGALLLALIAGLAVPHGDADGRRGSGGRRGGGLPAHRRARGAVLHARRRPARATCAGSGTCKTPLVILVVAHAVNVVLELLFVYGFGWGLAGSAWGTVIAQAGMGAAFVRVQLEAGWQRPSAERIRSLLHIGTDIAVRTSALLASFLVASAVLARVGAGVARGAPDRLPAVRLHRAGARRDRDRRAGDGGADARRRRRRPGRARPARRMIGWSVVAGTMFGLVLLAFADLIPRAFTSDAAVLERASEIWPLFALMMPANGAVFALDGILIGAGDTRFLMWGMLAAAAVYVPVALLALAEGWGIVGVWCGLVGLILVRLLTCGARFAGGRWALVGAPA